MLCLVFILAVASITMVSAITWTGGPVGTGTSFTDYDIYFNVSNTDVISYNLSEGGRDSINYSFVPGQKFIFGGDFA